MISDNKQTIFQSRLNNEYLRLVKLGDWENDFAKIALGGDDHDGDKRLGMTRSAFRQIIKSYPDAPREVRKAADQAYYRSMHPTFI